jgi:DNA-binding NtrC family response regulator
VVCDIRLPDMAGDELFERLQREQPALPPFLFITGYGQIDRAVALMKLGAVDYITKPFDVKALLDRALDVLGSGQDGEEDRPAVSCLGASPAMRQIDMLVHRFAPLDTTLLITGETGVGKEVVVRRLVALRRPGPFVAINCAAMAEGLVESELFGHEKGSFTGSAKTHKGVFERAAGGTLLLDEIGEMPFAIQAKLLRVIQDKAVVRVGGESSIPVDVRLVCATHQDLAQCVEQGRFREDLYYRINVIHIDVPPLRERKEDVLWLARAFLEEYAAAHGCPAPRLHPEAQQVLLMHSWPGNVRELRHCLERASIFCRTSVMTKADILQALGQTEPPGAAGIRRLDEFLLDCERRFIRYCLDKHHGRIVATAADLGISRKALWDKMRRLGVTT